MVSENLEPWMGRRRSAIGDDGGRGKTRTLPPPRINPGAEYVRLPGVAGARPDDSRSAYCGSSEPRCLHLTPRACPRLLGRDAPSAFKAF